MSGKNTKKEVFLNSNYVKENGLTYDDYASLNDDNRYELAGGRLELMSPAPSVTHQLVSSEIYKNITASCEADYIALYAPIDVILSSTEVRQPDLVLVDRKRMNILSRRGIEGAPDLVVEILSPSTLKRDKLDKLKTYAAFQISEYWIVDPEAGILEAYTLKEERYELTNIFQGTELVTSPIIPCISFTMAEILENIPKL
ncbi:Uma2 family endonuclease [Aquibacillus salsiterrae]|uniref:Uma2 family endonuclease n=1 Tax=Aquibacillus salsiterrae TaxID=2950439 RepID=A0A9X3WHE0_9BACI|nr:Uma2 family endonuclease [Aquibacillus salsiterrae]MDC3418638.1 Uma2 family endonuclease [Aquibacillus salsiterrae]